METERQDQTPSHRDDGDATEDPLRQAAREVSKLAAVKIAELVMDPAAYLKANAQTSCP